MISIIAPAKTPEDIKNFAKNSKCREFYVYHHKFLNNNFEYAEEFINAAHSNESKVFINFKHNIKEEDIEQIRRFIIYLQNSKIDGIFINSYAVLEIIKEFELKFEVIIDSYFDIHNLAGIDFVNTYHKTDRIIITEEIYLKNIEKIKKYVKIPLAIDSDNLPWFCEDVKKSKSVDFIVIKGKFKNSKEILDGILLVEKILARPKVFKNQKLPFKHLRRSFYKTNHFSGEMLSAEGRDFKFSRNIQRFDWELKGSKLKGKANYSALNIPRVNLRLSSLEQLSQVKKFIKKLGFNPIYSVEYGEVASTSDLFKNSFNEILLKVKRFCEENNILLNLSTPRILIERDFDRVYEHIKSLVLSEPHPASLIINNIGFWWNAINDSDLERIPIEIGGGINLLNSLSIQCLNNLNPIEAIDFSTFENIDNIAMSIENVKDIIPRKKLLIAGCVRVESLGLCPLNNDSAIISRLSCKAPCHKGHYALKDPMLKKVYPFVADGFCRMHMFESEIMQNFDMIPYLQDIGVNEFIIDFSAIHSAIVPKLLTNYLNALGKLSPLVFK